MFRPMPDVKYTLSSFAYAACSFMNLRSNVPPICRCFWSGALPAMIGLPATARPLFAGSMMSYVTPM